MLEIGKRTRPGSFNAAICLGPRSKKKTMVCRPRKMSGPGKRNWFFRPSKMFCVDQDCRSA